MAKNEFQKILKNPIVLGLILLIIGVLVLTTFVQFESTITTPELGTEQSTVFYWLGPLPPPTNTCLSAAEERFSGQIGGICIEKNLLIVTECNCRGRV